MTKQRPPYEAKMLTEARKIATDVVKRQFPEFANVEPLVSERRQRATIPPELRRLGVQSSAVRVAPITEYTFTFATEIRTPDGYTMPRVARVTVDSNRRVLKSIVSK